MRCFIIFVTAVCVMFLMKLRWPKKKSFFNRHNHFKPHTNLGWAACVVANISDSYPDSFIRETLKEPG